jgi:hypothetical protein
MKEIFSAKVERGLKIGKQEANQDWNLTCSALSFRVDSQHTFISPKPKLESTRNVSKLLQISYSYKGEYWVISNRISD